MPGTFDIYQDSKSFRDSNSRELRRGMDGEIGDEVGKQGEENIEPSTENNVNMDEHMDSSDSSDSEDDEKKNEEKEAKILALSKEISQNPYVYDKHPEKIRLLRDIGDLTRLREARELMNKHFPLTEELWLDWLRDEIKLVSENSEREKVGELFEAAFLDYQSVPIWLEYVQFAIGRMAEEDGIDKVRQAFERALAAVGLHVSQGAHIWEAYREFESAVTAGLMPQAGSEATKEQEEAFTAQNQKVISLFKRQIQVPLLNMESSLTEYKEWLGEDKVDSQTKSSYDKAFALLKEFEQFEDKILNSSGSEQLLTYMEYIAHEQSKKDPSRILCVFERALKDHCLVAELWLTYTAYLDKLNSRQHIRLGYERALRNCPWYSQLWVNWLLALERKGNEFVQIKEAADKALQVGFTEASDYLAVWSAYCDYLKRRINWDKKDDNKEPLETFHLTIESAVEFMFSNYGKEGDPEGRLRQFWAYTEARFCSSMEKAREIWTKLMQEGHGPQAGMWLQYFRLERRFGDSKRCRKILQKALNSVTDWPESITTAYLNFEREEGDLEQFDTAQAKCQAQLSRIEERRVKAEEKEAFQEKKKKGDKKSQKNTQDNLNQSANIFKKSAEVDKKQNKRKMESNTKPEQNSGEFKKPFDAEPQAKKSKKEPEQAPKAQAETEVHGESRPHDSSKDNVTAFVSNLDFSLEIERLRDIFHKCGQITDVRLVKNYKGKSKGYGYVEFIDCNAVLQAMRLDRELIDGRPMYVSRCEDRKTTKSAPVFKYANNLEKTKLFIKNLPFTCTKDALETIFKEHGKLKEVRLVTYRSGAPKGLAYVEFENESSATKAVLATDGLQIGEHAIAVAISCPPERKSPMSTSMDDLIGMRTPSLGSGKKETDFRGKARTQVSLVPRALRQSQKATVTTTTKPLGSTPSSSATPSTAAMSNDDFRKMLLKK